LDHLAGSVGLRDGRPHGGKRDAMVRSGAPDGADGQQSLGDLVALAAKDISQLVRYEISLAKSELRMDMRRVGITSALAAFAAVVVALIAFVLCFAYAYGLEAAGAPGGLWGAFLFVALTLFVLLLIACGVAYLVIKRVTGMRLTRESMQGNLEMLRRGEVSPDGAGPAVRNPPLRKEESVRAGATAEIPARQLPGGEPDGHAIRICRPDQRAMDAPFGQRERHPLPRGDDGRRAARPALARLSRVLVDMAPPVGLAVAGRLPGGRGRPSRLRRQRQAAAWL
jgi:hypothetical protein